MLVPAWLFPGPRGFLLGINTGGGGGCVKQALVSESESELDIGDSDLGGVAGLLAIVSSETEGSFLTEDVENPSASPLVLEPLDEIFVLDFLPVQMCRSEG